MNKKKILLVLTVITGFLMGMLWVLAESFLFGLICWVMASCVFILLFCGYIKKYISAFSLCFIISFAAGCLCIQMTDIIEASNNLAHFIVMTVFWAMISLFPMGILYGFTFALISFIVWKQKKSEQKDKEGYEETNFEADDETDFTEKNNSFVPLTLIAAFLSGIILASFAIVILVIEKEPSIYFLQIIQILSMAIPFASPFVLFNIYKRSLKNLKLFIAIFSVFFLLGCGLGFFLYYLKMESYPPSGTFDFSGVFSFMYFLYSPWIYFVFYISTFKSFSKKLKGLKIEPTNETKKPSISATEKYINAIHGKGDKDGI